MIHFPSFQDCRLSDVIITHSNYAPHLPNPVTVISKMRSQISAHIPPGPGLPSQQFPELSRLPRLSYFNRPTKKFPVLATVVIWKGQVTTYTVMS